MKKVIVATAAFALMCGSAFAQNQTGPSPQSNNMTKPGMSNTDKTHKGTTGMSNGTTGGTATGGAMRPDASGQGGSGPGSDQGGTRTNMK